MKKNNNTSRILSLNAKLEFYLSNVYHQREPEIAVSPWKVINKVQGTVRVIRYFLLNGRSETKLLKKSINTQVLQHTCDNSPSLKDNILDSHKIIG